MDACTELFRRIALYRKYLSEGVDAELAREYLHEIAGAEAELAGIKRRAGKTDDPARARTRFSSPCRTAPQ